LSEYPDTALPTENGIRFSNYYTSNTRHSQANVRDLMDQTELALGKYKPSCGIRDS
jgi:hypothetical protein